ncbi:MAG: lipocalin family protein [Ignavibacteria bacterium]|nr:lipocalin family protein [Ignavibacteria bacterium]
MKILFLNLASLFLFILFGCGKNYPPLKTVEFVDLSKYSGKWYEIARSPNRFQKDCLCSTAEYSVIDRKTISVLNKCIEKDGVTIDSVRGKAFLVDTISNSKLKVQFFWPFRGDYWIIDLDEKNYTYAVVGSPDRKYFWILVRDKNFPDEKLSELLNFLKENQFNTDNVIINKQNCLDKDIKLK